MDMVLLSTILLIIVALGFDFINGCHDCSNSIATIVSTKVLSPIQAVIWASFFNFISFLFFGLAIANTIGKGIIEPSIIDSYVIFSALSGAIIWNIITLKLGIPSSSSHALVGGLIGAGIAKVGISSLLSAGITKVCIAIILSPVVGFILSILLILIISWTFKNYSAFTVDKYSRYFQLVSSAAYSMGHGGSDAQKTMGIIAVLLFANGYLGSSFFVPLWVVIICQSAMALGTLLGGWKIVKTMGLKITDLKPIQGCCAETSGAITLFSAIWFGTPVSSTHTITGAIIGVGTAKRASSVRWDIAANIITAWVLTLPCSAFIAVTTYYILSIF